MGALCGRLLVHYTVEHRFPCIAPLTPRVSREEASAVVHEVVQALFIQKMFGRRRFHEKDFQSVHTVAQFILDNRLAECERPSGAGDVGENPPSINGTGAAQLSTAATEVDIYVPSIKKVVEEELPRLADTAAALKRKPNAPLAAFLTYDVSVNASQGRR